MRGTFYKTGEEETLQTKGHFFRLNFGSSFVKNVFVNPTFLLPQHKPQCLLIQPCCQHTIAVCFQMLVPVKAFTFQRNFYLND